jgi:hypothetical protein
MRNKSEKKYKITKKRKIKRGGELTKKEKSRYIQTYRNQQNFIEPFIEYIDAVRMGKVNNDGNAIKNAVENIKALFNDDYLNKYINALIPIRFNRIPALKSKYDPDDIEPITLSNKRIKKMIVNYISPLSVVFDHVPNKYYKELLDAFIKAGGNINLKSSMGKDKETTLSNEIDKNNGYAIKLLIDNNVDTLSLSKEDSDKLVEIIKNYDETQENLSDTESTIVEPVLEEPIAEPVLEEPIVEPVLEEPIVEPVLEEPVKEEVTKEVKLETANIINENEEKEIISNAKEITDLQSISEPTKNLLDVNSFKPDEYEANKVPSYWLPIFESEQKMVGLKNRIMSILVQDDLQKSLTKSSWISCDIVERLFPSYFVNKMVHEQVKRKDNNLNQRSIVNDEYNEYMMLCVLLLLLGIISEKMSGQNYNFIFKGGKAIQLVLSQILGAEKYISDDIDILIVPQNDTPYNRENIILLGKNLAYLLKWFVSFPNVSTITPTMLSIKEAKVSNSADNVVKLALFRITGPKVLVDIGIHDIPENVKVFFENPQSFSFYIRELGEKALFRCPKLDAIIKEKLFYFVKYLNIYNKYANNIPVTEPDFANIRDNTSGMRTCQFFMEKFGRALKALFSEKLKEDVQYSKMNDFQKKFQKRTIAELYLDGMGVDKSVSKQLLSLLQI